MNNKSDLSHIHTALDDFESYFDKQFEGGTIQIPMVNGDPIHIVFLSIGNPQIRARVLKTTANDFKKAFTNLRQKAIRYIRKNHIDPYWLKVDIVQQIEPIPFKDFEKKIARTKKNYFRSGVSFDNEFRIAFLEQEINGNAMIRSVKKGQKGPLQLNEKNINHYLKTNYNNKSLFIKKRYESRPVYLFQTTSAFIGKENPIIYDLYNGNLTNGIRKIDDMETEVMNLIQKSTYYLTNQVTQTGKFTYGYFSAFGKKIGTYNILRHSSSLYAMAEGYEFIQDEKIIQTVERGIDYLIREAIVYQENKQSAYVVDHANQNEIKLGSNATAILAMTKYMEMTHSTKYLEIAQALARGIIQMKTPSGGFIHVLEYPTFEIKELHRIIYYEGEAIFSLLRLYAIDKEETWLDEVKASFAYFIANDYWKHHDHWLSYAANELTIYEPEDTYFIFGLKNCNNRLNFIYHRETTYPTFLELTMAAYKMIHKIKQMNKEYLLEYIDEVFLEETIDRRAEYQRVGFFYPELAMYMKEPDLILDGFFIRHHSFRVRIDDVEHYLSGYCQYYKHRISNMKHNELVNI